MARKIVFVNGSGDTITFDNQAPLLLTSVEGLGTPSTNLQEQKAPYQDGTTYIDALLDKRMITCQVSITEPNDFASIDTYRRELAHKLNPKLGQGTLTYYTENGASYKITAIPVSSPIFPNKEYAVPYLKAQVTFACNDPYWKKVTDGTATLTGLLDSTVSVINASTTSYISLIQQSNNTFRVAYRDGSFFGLIVQRTSTDGITWSARSTIGDSGVGLGVCLIQQSDNTFRVAYIRTSDFYLCQVTSADGITWSAESVITSADSGATVSLIQEASGSFRISYVRASDSYLVQKTSSDGITWSAESIINNSACTYSTMIQEASGSFRVMYKSSATQYLVQRTSADGITWSAPSNVNTIASNLPSLVQMSNGFYRVSFIRVSDAYLVQQTSTDGITWGVVEIISSVTTAYPSIIQQTNGAFRVAYMRFGDNYLVQKSSSLSVTHASDVSIPCTIRFNGPAINPRIDNLSTSEYIRLVKTLATGDYFIVDTSFGNKTVKLFINGIESNGIAYLDINSTFFKLDPGSTAMSYSDETPTGTTATATVTWTERYVGV